MPEEFRDTWKEDMWKIVEANQNPSEQEIVPHIGIDWKEKYNQLKKENELQLKYLKKYNRKKENLSEHEIGITMATGKVQEPIEEKPPSNSKCMYEDCPICNPSEQDCNHVWDEQSIFNTKVCIFCGMKKKEEEPTVQNLVTHISIKALYKWISEIEELYDPKKITTKSHSELYGIHQCLAKLKRFIEEKKK